jgi:hypothetical protein
MKSYKKFLILYAIVLGVFAIPLGVNLLFLTHAYENMSLRDVAKEQHRKDALYGTALSRNAFGHKLELVKEVKPRVIALGSSRSLGIREELFTVPFVNCGNAMNALNEGRMFIEELTTFHKPELIIMGVDFWWFSEEVRQPERYGYHRNDGTQLTLDKMYKPFEYIFTSKLELRDYLNIALFKKNKNDITNYANMGLIAIIRGSGFRKDGSHLYADTIFGQKGGGRSIQLQTVKSKKGKRHIVHAYGSEISQKRVEELHRIIALCKEKGIELIVIYPPVSDSAYEQIMANRDQFEYFFRVQEVVSALPVEHYIFQSTHSISSSNCECIDSVHIGEVAYQRLFLAILERNPDSLLKKYINEDLLRSSVSRLNGRVLAIFDTDKGRFNYPEKDFLKIGCQREQ